jgi:hypothetical protein
MTPATRPPRPTRQPDRLASESCRLWRPAFGGSPLFPDEPSSRLWRGPAWNLLHHLNRRPSPNWRGEEPHAGGQIDRPLEGASRELH